MSQQLSVATSMARTLLNDDSNTVWTDPALIPKCQIAHRELQAILKQHSCPIMKGLSNDINVPINATTLTLPTDIQEPLRLWEKAPSDPESAYVLMTESATLPVVSIASTLVYWQWFQETIIFVGSNAQRYVRLEYWRILSVPQATTDLLGFINAEFYIAPRAASMCAISTGNSELSAALKSDAQAQIASIVAANRGRLIPQSGVSSRP
jgi:hypothetical protein